MSRPSCAAWRTPPPGLRGHVPSLLVATWMLSLVVGDAPIGRYAERLANVLPDLALAVTPLLAQLFGSGKAEGTALGIYLAFLVGWVAVSIPLTYVYRVVAPSALSWRSATWGAFITGSMISGFVQGFVLFLALPLDIGRPFGGFRPVAAMAVVGLWMALLHILVLVGYQLTAGIDDRGGTPWHPPEPVGERGDDPDPDGGRAATPCRPGAN